jgi:UDP-glucose 6-dehydrogenase
VAIDTPVDDADVANTDVVFSAIESAYLHVKDGAVLLISSQLPAGRTRMIEKSLRSRFPKKLPLCLFTGESAAR